MTTERATMTSWHSQTAASGRDRGRAGGRSDLGARGRLVGRWFSQWGSRLAFFAAGASFVAVFLISGATCGGPAAARRAELSPGGGAGGDAPLSLAVPAWADQVGGATGRHTIADVAARVTPSVVNLSATRVRRFTGNQGASTHPLFRHFFGPMGPPGGLPRERQERSLGSGVIVRPDGYILTNHHVVENADSIKVELSDNRVFEANVVGSDPPSDLALLQIQAQKLPAIRFGDATKSRVGDVVLAVGNPFGVGETVTMGIISAVGRAHMGITDYDDFIQTDAAINPGNSGGALVNLRGELVGINTAIVSRTGGFQGVGFAIPSNMARTVSESLRTTGRVVRGWLGVSIQSVTPELAQGLGLPNSVRGAVVSEVQANSPAQRAGLQQGDVIFAVNGQPVDDAGRLRAVVASLGAGAQARLEVRRQARTVTVTTQLGELPQAQQSAGNVPAVNGDSKLSGVAVAAIGPRERQQYGIAEAVRGVVVTSVDGNSFAARSGLLQGDVIVEVNRQPVTTPAEFQRAATQAGQQVLLLVHRQGRTIYLAWQ